MIKKMRIIGLSVLLAITSTLLSVSAFQSSAPVDPPENVQEIAYNKIHCEYSDEEFAVIDDADELQLALNTLNESTYRNEFDEVLLTVRFKGDIRGDEQYREIAKSKNELKNISEIRQFRMRLNQYSKAYHDALIDSSMPILDGIPYSKLTRIGYTPFVQLTVAIDDLSEEMITDLANCEEIESVSLSFDIPPVECVSWNTALQEANAYAYVANQTYTGEGVRIGIQEAGGICDTTNVNLSNIDITFRDASVGTKDHATLTASIVALIAPDAEYYMCKWFNYGIEWFIDQYCDVVNCSYCYASNTEQEGHYTVGPRYYRETHDAIYDYQIDAHFITVVNSAGNKQTNDEKNDYNPDSKILSPSYAYNVISVGGVERELVGGIYRWNHASNANYVCSHPLVKPNITAPYTVTVPNLGVHAGTSITAPQVTGYIALLIEKEFMYSCYPERILSAITSTANKSDDYNATIGEFDQKVGAGIVNLFGMMVSNQDESDFNDNVPSGYQLISKTIPTTIYEEDEVRVAFSWVVGTNGQPADHSVNNTYVTNYELYVYGPNNTVYSSELTDSNVELIRFIAPTTGTYTIKVYQISALNTGNDGDWYSLNYCIL